MPENDTESNPHAYNSLHNADNSISITQNEIIDSANICYSPSWSLPTDTNEHYNRIDDTNHEIDDDVSSPILPTSLKFNRNTMSISVKRLAARTAADRLAQRFESTLQNPSDFNEDNENIICSPNFSAIESMDANNHSNHSEPNATQSQFERFNFDARHLNENYKQLYQSHDTDHDEVDGNLKSNESPNDRLMELIRCKDPLRSAVVLRSPRGNQPRTYTTDALYSALMDVKSGESIYR